MYSRVGWGLYVVLMLQHPFGHNHIRGLETCAKSHSEQNSQSFSYVKAIKLYYQRSAYANPSLGLPSGCKHII